MFRAVAISYLGAQAVRFMEWTKKENVFLLSKYDLSDHFEFKIFEVIRFQFNKWLIFNS